MKNAYRVFQRLIDQVKEDTKLYRALKSLNGQAVDASDVLRWQWTQAVSALDKLIHDLVRIGMIEIYEGRRPATDAYNGFRITMKDRRDILLSGSAGSSAFEAIVVDRNSYEAYQSPKNIANGLSYIWSEAHKWKNLANRLGLTEENARTYMQNICDRRNQIVHEGDYSSQSLARQELSTTDVKEVISFIRSLGKAIYSAVK